MFITILHHYLVWHYSRAYFEFFRIWMNLLWFVFHFFSIKQLALTLFSPWKRITEERTKAWDFEEFAGAILINIISRIIGAIVRTVVLITGLVSALLLLVGGVLVYLVWLLAPVVILTLIIMGIIYIVV